MPRLSPFPKLAADGQILLLREKGVPAWSPDASRVFPTRPRPALNEARLFFHPDFRRVNRHTIIRQNGINPVAQTRRWFRFVKIVGRFIYKDALLLLSLVFFSPFCFLFLIEILVTILETAFNIVIRKERDLSTLLRCFQSSVFRGIY